VTGDHRGQKPKLQAGVASTAHFLQMLLIFSYMAPPGERYYNMPLGLRDALLMTIMCYHIFHRRVVECGIVRFLCAMRVLDIRVSSSSLRLHLCQISFLCDLRC